MKFTPSTVPFLILLPILFVAARRQMLPVLLFLSVFQAAAVVLVGSGSHGVGIMPVHLAFLLLVAQQIFGRQRLAPPPSLRQRELNAILLLFASYAILSAVFCPLFFSGIPVRNPRVGSVPLTWSSYNETQSAYLLLGMCVYLISARRRSPPELDNCLKWYLAGSTMAALFAIYQYISFVFKIPFPTEILHSNTLHTIFEAYQSEGGFTRVSSTFSEASAAAACFSVAVALALSKLFWGKRSRRLVASLALLVTALILTRSTTGYIALGFLVVGAASFYFRKMGAAEKLRRFRLGFAVSAVLISGALLIFPDSRASIRSLLDAVLFTKGQSSSYAERQGWNEAAFRAALSTYGFGAGWGSLRASSFLANMLGTVGVPGLFLFAGFISLLLRYATAKERDGEVSIQKIVVFPIVIFLVGAVVAGPELTDPSFWFLLGTAASGKRRGIPSLRRPPSLQDAEAAVSAISG